MKKIRNQKLQPITKMPKLKHKIGGSYNPNTSEVLEWIKGNNLFLEFVLEKAKDSKLIIYDSKTGLWQGKDFE